MITHHTQLLNALIEKYGLTSYLEIGVQDPANNFDKIKCDIRVGVDPELPDTDKTRILEKIYVICSTTSDSFFEDRFSHRSMLFDLIFIDGLHHADQVKRDFENSLRCLSNKGFIVIHDVLPENEEGTVVPRKTKVWWGDVYKLAMNISTYPGIGYKTFNIDNGCMLIWKDNKETYTGRLYNPEYSTYLSWGKVAMKVTDEINQFTI